MMVSKKVSKKEEITKSIFIIDKDISLVNEKIEKYAKSYRDKKNLFQDFLSKEYNSISCKVSDSSIEFCFNNKYEIYMYPRGEAEVNLMIYQRGYISNTEDKGETNNFLMFHSMLINSEKGKDLINRVLNFWDGLVKFTEESDLKSLYDQKSTLTNKKYLLEKNINKIKDKENRNNLITQEYYEVCSSFYIKNNKKKMSHGHGRWSRSNKSVYLYNKAVIKIDTVSRGKANFNITCLEGKQVHKFTKIHADFIKQLLDREYIKALAVEDAMERAMELFQ